MRRYVGPLLVTRLSSVVRSSFRANLKDNRRQTDLCGLKDKQGSLVLFWFDNGDGGD